LSGSGPDLERAESAAEDALAIACRLHSPLCLAHVARALGAVALYQAALLLGRGRRASAMPHFARAEAAMAERLAITWELENLYDTASCLFDLAGIAWRRGRGERAALLLGACEALMEAEGLTVDPDGREMHAYLLERLRPRFGVALQDGRDKPLRELVALAVAPGREDGGTVRHRSRRSGRTKRRRPARMRRGRR
jgi:hypothetical protein